MTIPCKQCGKPMNPVDAMVSDTYGVRGKVLPRKPAQG